MRLDNITLVCIDDLDPERASHLLIYLNDLISFESTKLFCSSFSSSLTVNVPPIKSIHAHDKFLITSLHEYVDTDFCMIVQRDGFFININAWRSEFLDYDYIGAPWPNGDVGNGGFSIRSKSLLKFIANHPISGDPQCDFSPEDGKICSTFRQGLEDAGHRFAPTDIAARFSREDLGVLPDDVFGFHGKSGFFVNKYTRENPSFADVPKFF